MTRPSRRIRGRPPGAPNKPKPVEPTPQTLAKLRPHGEPLTWTPDAIAALPEELQHAAGAIARAYSALVARLMCRASVLAPQSPGKPADLPRPILVLVLRYQAWIREAARRHLRTAALIDVIVDGWTPEQSDRFHQLKPGTAARTLEAGLELYAKTQPPNLEARLAETDDQHAA